MTDPRPSRPPSKAKPCPICAKPAAPLHVPFCSDRCRKVDLHRWLGETYRIPQTDAPQPGVEDEDYDE
jgi:endogenous inhibitor of DNA gyrase (YacG/DUF329 family)